MKDSTAGKPSNGKAIMAKRLLAEKMRHIKTSKGFTGLGGGRWGGKMPRPPQWYSSSTQLCGIYPFSAGTSRPNTGTPPLGRDMNVDTAVCGDMKTWYDAGLISSSSMMLFGLNGNGKSSVAQRFIYSMAARGIIPMVFDPLKDEYGEMVEAMGGRVLRVGPRGRDKINLLHLGALGGGSRQDRRHHRGGHAPPGGQPGRGHGRPRRADQPRQPALRQRRRGPGTDGPLRHLPGQTCLDA